MFYRQKLALSTHIMLLLCISFAMTLFLIPILNITHGKDDEICKEAFVDISPKCVGRDSLIMTVQNNANYKINVRAEDYISSNTLNPNERKEISLTYIKGQQTKIAFYPEVIDNNGETHSCKLKKEEVELDLIVKC